MSSSPIEFVESLVERFPELFALFKEHKEYYDVVLPHVFLWDVTDYVVSLAVQSESKVSQDKLRRILDDFEVNYVHGNDEIRELISVSFLEHLPRFNDPGAEIRQMVGPNLAKQLDLIG